MAAYCAYQDRCHYEVEKKLNDFFLIPEARDEILLFLIQHNFLNEERFAKNFAYSKFYYKKWGRNKIEIELKKRNIYERLIATGMQEIDPDDYHTVFRELAEEKAKSISGKTAYERNVKLTRYLLQKGYEYELVKECIASL